ncbi:hypothetical protein PP352_21670 [Mycobacteroides abscessus]|nr:hypothetical protein [Mycobacteroides abscessus]
MSSSSGHAPNARKSAARLYQRARPGTPYTVAAREAEWLVALAENIYVALADFKGHHALLITGHAGVGKTRLMLKLAALWEQSGAEIVAYGPPGGGSLASPYPLIYGLGGLRPGQPRRQIMLLDSGFVPDSDPSWRPYGFERIWLDNGDRWGPLPGVHVMATAQMGMQRITSVGSTVGSWRTAISPRSMTLAWARMVEESWGLRASVNIHLDIESPGGPVRAFLRRPGAEVQEFSLTDSEPWRPCPR